MYAIKEISTGYWLTPNDTFVPWNPEAEPVLVEAETEAELEDKRDALNAAAGFLRFTIGSHPRH